MTGMTIKELAEMAGISYQWLHKIDVDLPDDQKLLAKSANGAKYDPAFFVQRWVDYRLRKQNEEVPEDGSTDRQFAMTRKELAALAGYSYQQLYNIDCELPNGLKLFEMSEDGKKCSLALFVQRWAKYNYNRGADLEDLSLDEVRAQHEQVKKEKTQLQVAKMRGELVDVEEVRLLWANIANNIMQNMIRLPSSIAPQVQMMDNVELIAGIIDREIREVLTALANTPLPEEAADEPDTEEQEEDEE